MVTQLGFLFWIGLLAVVLHARAATNVEAWSVSFPQSSLVALLPDRLGRIAAVTSTSDSNVVVLLATNGSNLVSAYLPITTNLPSPAQAACADAAGHIYIVGQAHPSLAYISTVKFQPGLTGVAWSNVTLITNPTAPARLAIVREIVADNFGNAYIVGRFSQYVGDIDQFALSVSAAGDRWFDEFNPAAENDFDKAISILRGNDGSLFVAGHSDHFTPSGSSILARRFAPGGAILWASNYLATATGPSYAFSETASAAALDSSFNLVISGGRAEGFERGYLTMKIDPWGDVLWRAILNHSNDLFAATGMAIDAHDNVIVTGSIGTAKYSAEGTLLWHSPEAGSSVCISASGSIVLSGSVRNTNVSDRLIIRTTALLANGSLAWSAEHPADPVNDHVFKSMFVDRSGAIYVGFNAGNSAATILKYIEPGRLTVRLNNASQIVLSWPATPTNTVVTSTAVVNDSSW
ncbi:MAG TPA: hypothetical protein VK530_05155, partial [Candidatus Acidoferrum sp.]|nr:hypothetical protein [Candidatus Acidoferrum sp.]